jgi:hypothetical protein
MKTLLGALTLSLMFLSSVTAAELCLVPSAANDRSITVVCGGTAYDNAQLGYGTDGQASCSDLSPLCWFTSSDPIGWAISASTTDPFDNTGPINESASLYLWFACDNVGRGIAVVEFDLAATNMEVTGFTPMNGFLNAGTATELLLAVGGCPMPLTLAGRIDVETTVGVDADTWGRVKTGYR